MRPDGRCFVRGFDTRDAAATEALAIVVAESSCRLPLYATVDERDDRGRLMYERAGFVINRCESLYRVPTDPALTRLHGVEAPAGIVPVSAERVDVDRLRLLDDMLRQDVPGTDGWRWTDAAFRAETFSPEFDPETYLVAVHEGSGAYVGIVRVWIRSPVPRLGFIGVTAPFRRRGVARALLARVFAALHDRGVPDVTTEIDETNVASRQLIENLGARPTGGTVELVRPATCS